MKKSMKVNIESSNLIIYSVVFISVASLGYIFSHFKTGSSSFSKVESHQINYEMAKIANKPMEYSLSDREVDSSYQALEKEAKKTATKTTDSKKADDKNKKAKVDDKKTADKKLQLAQQNKTQNKSNKKTETVVKLQGPIQSHKILDNKLNSTTPAVQSAVYNNTQVKKETNVSAENQNDKKNEIKTISQWRTELLTQQNKDAVVKFSNAFKKGEVSASDFMNLTNEFVKSNDQKVVGLGLYILRMTPSTISYTQLIKIQSQLNSEYANYVEVTLNSYNQPAYLGILKSSLSNSDKTVVSKTLNLINFALTNIKEGTTSNLVESRYRRLDQTKDYSVANYASFVPDLQKIASDMNDGDLSRLANQNIELIQTQNIAAN